MTTPKRLLAGAVNKFEAAMIQMAQEKKKRALEGGSSPTSKKASRGGGMSRQAPADTAPPPDAAPISEMTSAGSEMYGGGRRMTGLGPRPRREPTVRDKWLAGNNGNSPAGNATRAAMRRSEAEAKQVDLAPDRMAMEDVERMQTHISPGMHPGRDGALDVPEMGQDDSNLGRRTLEFFGGPENVPEVVRQFMRFVGSDVPGDDGSAKPAARRQTGSKYPPAPKDEGKRRQGAIYMAPNGRKVKWMGDGWELVDG